MGCLRSGRLARNEAQGEIVVIWYPGQNGYHWHSLVQYYGYYQTVLYIIEVYAYSIWFLLNLLIANNACVR